MDGDNAPGIGGIVLDLLTQISDVTIESAIVDVPVTCGALDELLARKGLTQMRGERFENSILGWCERDRDATSTNFMRFAIDFEDTDVLNAATIDARAFTSPRTLEDAFNPRDDFTRAKWFTDVLIGAARRADRAVGVTDPRRQHDHGRLRDLAKMPQDVPPHWLGKVEIEDDERDVLGENALGRGDTHEIFAHDETVVAQIRREHLDERGLVFQNQNSIRGCGADHNLRYAPRAAPQPNLGRNVRRRLRNTFAADRHHHPMTTIDFEDGLELLHEHDIRVVRARVVDSAEDAVAFAERHPIELGTLYWNADSTPKDFESDLQTTDRIRNAYRRLEERSRALPGARILARRSVEAGADVVIDARDDAILGRIVELRGGGHAAHRLLPLGERQAEALLGEFDAKHGIAANETQTRMLANLLLRISDICADDAVARITLDPVRVRGNSYDVLAVHVAAKRPLQLHRRLAKHAHDRKGYYAPSGRQ